MTAKKYLGGERRRYIRLDSVFPVQFRLLSIDGKHFLSDWLQGFTSDVSKGGLCLSINNLNPEFAKLLKEQKVKLSLEIDVPASKNPVNAIGRIAWSREVPGSIDKYLVGVSYEEIDAAQNNKIIHFAWAKRLFAPVVLSVIAVLGVAFLINSLINIQLAKGNKALVEQLIKIVQESSIAKQKVKEITKEREDLRVKIDALKLRIQTIEEERAGLTAQAEAQESKKIAELDRMIGELTSQKQTLENELISVQHQENTVTEELLRLDKRKADLEKANLDKMYKWLKVHQNPRTGLVMSFEGDNDMANWAFIYDQSLVAQAYTNFSDSERAKKLLDFFDKAAKRQDGLFYNAYYITDGTPAEYVVNSGPNIWLGIAIVHYTKKTQDSSYLALAEEVAQAILDLQAKDSDGGIRGGPETEWYSTEHNLDAYAFFTMLYQTTGKTLYEEGARKVLNWLVRHTYDQMDLPIKRGKGDSTIATDTYAWSIAAIGPEKLFELGMNPDEIVDFAEKNCAVTVNYVRPDGQTVKIKGFDFASQRHLARGGVVSSEWTAQMVIAFKIMADYYYKKEMVAKARSYEFKADEYLSNLSNMIISSPSPSGQGGSCLPYATQDFVDTGHGWLTPKGKATGSLAGTTYALFAYYNYNPLELKD